MIWFSKRQKSYELLNNILEFNLLRNKNYEPNMKNIYILKNITVKAFY